MRRLAERHVFLRAGIGLGLALLTQVAVAAGGWPCDLSFSTERPAPLAVTMPAREAGVSALRQDDRAAQAWQRLADTVDALNRQRASVLARVRTLNTFWNLAVDFDAQAQAQAASSQWVTPLALLQRGSGESADFAVAKYFSLLAAGVPPQTLRLVHTLMVTGSRATLRGHTVLAYCPAGDDPMGRTDPWILDNFGQTITRASLRPELTPVLSFNAEGRWQPTEAGAAADADDAQMPIEEDWRDFLELIDEEGWR